MMSIEIKINNVLLGMVDVTNIRQKENGECFYECVYLNRELGEAHRFHLKHQRSEGALSLSRKVFEAIEELSCNKTTI